MKHYSQLTIEVSRNKIVRVDFDTIDTPCAQPMGAQMEGQPMGPVRSN